MTPKQYLEEVCAPNVEEFNREPTSLRRAWAAVVSLHHIEDYLAADQSREVKDVRSELTAGFPDFAMLGTVANAGKHAVLARGAHRGLAAKDMHVGPGAAFAGGEYWSDGTSWKDMPDVVRLNVNGRAVDLQNLVRRALEFLRARV